MATKKKVNPLGATYASKEEFNCVKPLLSTANWQRVYVYAEILEVLMELPQVNRLFLDTKVRRYMRTTRKMLLEYGSESMYYISARAVLRAEIILVLNKKCRTVRK